MAHISFVGNVGADPELKYTQQGKPWLTLRVAWQEKYKDRAGSWVASPPVWVGVKLWGAQAENVAATVRKGMKVACVGRMWLETWESDHGPKQNFVMDAEYVAPALFTQTATVQPAQQQQSQPSNAQQHTGAVWNQPAAVPNNDDDEPPF